MDTRSHLTQWKHNRSLIERIPVQYVDWIVTVAFYSALYAVDALFIHDRMRSPTSHTDRISILQNTNKYSYIRDRFLPLYSLSRTVRYMADPVRWVPLEKVTTEVFSRLYGIEASVQKFMGRNLGFQPLVLSQL